MTQKRFLTDFYGMLARALASGAVRTSRASVRWDCSGDCLDGFERTFMARPSSEDHKRIAWADGSRHTMYLDIITRCHKCEKCMKHRSRLWRSRAKSEIRLAARTWMGTLTCSPDWHHVFQSRCRLRESRQGVDFDALPPLERWRCIHGEVSSEVTKAIKRLRANTGSPIRYLLVAEKHSQKLVGLPHFHMLIHEVRVDKPVRWTDLNSIWPFGFTKWKLVTSADAAAYVTKVTKYLTKSDAEARVRASLRYGEGPTRSTSNEFSLEAEPLSVKRENESETNDPTMTVSPDGLGE